MLSIPKIKIYCVPLAGSELTNIPCCLELADPSVPVSSGSQQCATTPVKEGGFKWEDLESAFLREPFVGWQETWL